MMKKQAASLLLVLLLSLTLPLFSASAANEGSTYVSDQAGLLTAEQYADLEARCAALTQRYECGVYVITLADFTNYGYSDIRTFGEALYTEAHLGCGEEQDGILLILSMADRDVYLLSHGRYGNGVFTEHVREEILFDSFLDNFRENDWYGGLSDYVSTCGAAFEDWWSAPAEEPVSPVAVIGRSIALAFLPAAVLSFVSCLAMKGSMKTARMATEASAYMTAQRGLPLRIQQDQYTHSTTICTPLNTNHNAHGPGGGGRMGSVSHHGSFSSHGGFSGGGRKF